MSKTIFLHGGEPCLVDDEDFEWLSKFKWYKSYLGYARRNAMVNGKHKNILMHREILGLSLKSKPEVDHINRSKLDNRKENLRLVSRAQNIQNTVRENQCGYRGVGRITDKTHPNLIYFIATITIKGKHTYLGVFKTPEDAARKYNKVAKEYLGEYAILNDI